MHDIKCPNSMVRAEVIEPKLFSIIDELTRNKEILNVRLTRLIKAQAEPNEALLESIHEQKKLIQENLRKQKKLTDVFMQDCVSMEVYKEKSAD